MAVKIGDNAPDVELVNVQGETERLSSFWNASPLLLVFLRHLGCPLCFDHVARIRERQAEFDAAGVRVVVVTMGTAEQAAKFKESQRLACEVLGDPKRTGYVAFGLDRGGAIQIAGPQMWWAGFRSLVKFGAAKPVGDIWQMPGAFAMAQGGKVIFAHRAAHSGDLESYDLIFEVFEKYRHDHAPLQPAAL